MTNPQPRIVAGYQKRWHGNRCGSGEYTHVLSNQPVDNHGASHDERINDWARSNKLFQFTDCEEENEGA